MDEIVVKSLSANNQIAVGFNTQPTKQQLSIPDYAIALKEKLSVFQQLTSYSFPTFTSEISGDDIPVKGFNDGLPEETNPLIQQDRNKAVEKVNNLLVKINKLKQDYTQKMESKSPCPYENTIAEYLGPNFVAPSISDLTILKDYSASAATNANLLINKRCHENMITQLKLMSAEATDPNFSGELSPVLGNAFAVLSATANGEQYVEDRHRAALHLEFAEIVRNIPIAQIIENPLEVAQKLISRYIEINKQILHSELTMIAE